VKLHLANPDGANVIRSSSPGAIVVNEDRYEGSLVITPEDILHPWGPNRIDELAPDDLEPVYELEPELLLLGTGDALVFPDREVLKTFAERNIGFEVMDTGAACRTYNVLMSEGRRVAAALVTSSS